MEAIEGLRFLASLPLASTGRTEGGEKTQPFNRFHSHLFTGENVSQKVPNRTRRPVSMLAGGTFCTSASQCTGAQSIQVIKERDRSNDRDGHSFRSSAIST